MPIRLLWRPPHLCSSRGDWARHSMVLIRSRPRSLMVRAINTSWRFSPLRSFPERPRSSLARFPKRLVTMDVTFEVTYSSDVDQAGLTLHDFSTFVNNNVQFQIWPYVRETFSALSARMGISPIVLPTLVRLPVTAPIGELVPNPAVTSDSSLNRWHGCPPP